jgi:hypothetical protein
MRCDAMRCDAMRCECDANEKKNEKKRKTKLFFECWGDYSTVSRVEKKKLLNEGKVAKKKTSVIKSSL